MDLTLTANPPLSVNLRYSDNSSWRTTRSSCATALRAAITSAHRTRNGSFGSYRPRRSKFSVLVKLHGHPPRRRAASLPTPENEPVASVVHFSPPRPDETRSGCPCGVISTYEPSSPPLPVHAVTTVVPKAKNSAGVWNRKPRHVPVDLVEPGAGHCRQRIAPTILMVLTQGGVPSSGPTQSHRPPPWGATTLPSCHAVVMHANPRA